MFCFFQMVENKKNGDDGMNGGTRNGGGHRDDDEGTEMTEIVVRRSMNGVDGDADVVINVVTEKSKTTTTTTIKEEVSISPIPLHNDFSKKLGSLIRRKWLSFFD